MSPAWLFRNLAFATMSVAVTAHAQTTSLSSAPATVARAFFRDLEAKEWFRAVQFIHQDALDSFRAEQLRNAQKWPPAGDSTLSPEDRAHFDSIRSLMRRRRNPLLEYFPGIPTIDSLGRLPPSVFLARFWQSGDPSVLGYPDSSPHAIRKVLRARIVSDTLAYIVYRMTVDNHFPSPGPHILEARKSHKRWLFLLNDELKCIGGCWTTYIVEPDST